MHARGGGAAAATGTPREAPAGGPVVLDRSNPEFLAGAYETYAELRAKGPVVRARYVPVFGDDPARQGAPEAAGAAPAEGELLFVTHHEAAAAALVDDRLSSDPYVLSTPEERRNIPEQLLPIAHSLLWRDPPDHRRLRKLVQPSFGARAMEALRPRIQKLADDLLDEAERAAAARGERAPDRRMDLVEAFAYPLPVAVISDMLGIPPEDRHVVRQWSDVRVASPRDPAAMEEGRERVRSFTRYLEDLFERKRREPADDMITQMVFAQEDGDSLGKDELLSMVFLLYFAGHVTTVNLVSSGAVALFSHPDQLARFRADPGLAKGLVEETLRYWGPVDFPGTLRTAREDMELAGTSIPKGARVAVGLGSANRDPARFANPDTFDITRPDAGSHIAFGKGIHLCLGAPLARLEGQIAFETLFRRLPDLRLAVPAGTLRWDCSDGLRGFAEVPVLF